MSFWPRKKPSLPGPLTPPSAVTDFLKSEATGGIALVVAAALAVVWANLGDTYFSFWHTELSVGFGDLSISEDLQHWINDGLMTLFFFVVALEIKRELAIGELSNRKAATMPVLAAFGGAILPALIFLALVTNDGAERGWAIPMATDIAFAVGVLALLGDRISSGVKVLLLSIAIVDDIIAIAVIALFYSSDLQPQWLLGAVAAYAVMVGMKRFGVSSIAAYVPLGAVIWLATLESGVHATMAGVAIGLLTPARPVGGREVLNEIEHKLHPYTSLLIVPLFALANAGIVFSSETLSDAVTSELALAIALGLIVGKLVGIGGTITLVERIGLGSLPAGVRRAQIWGVAALGGIGFTVSLFIAQLSYVDPERVDIAKLGIFSGSLISAGIGVTLLILAARNRKDGSKPAAGET